jgi:hypothetical protein
VRLWAEELLILVMMMMLMLLLLLLLEWGIRPRIQVMLLRVPLCFLLLLELQEQLHSSSRHDVRMSDAPGPCDYVWTVVDSHSSPTTTPTAHGMHATKVVSVPVWESSVQKKQFLGRLSDLQALDLPWVIK